MTTHVRMAVCALSLLLFAVLPAHSAVSNPGDTKISKLEYPPAKVGDTVDSYNGVDVRDPYRWLEDVDSPETHDWVVKENALTRAFLDKVPARRAIENRLTELWNYERSTVPFRDGGRLFYTKNNGLQNQNVLYVQDAPKAVARVLLDPNKLSKDGTVALAQYDTTVDGKLMAYGLSSSGSDWEDWHVKDVATGKDLSDQLKWLKNAGVAWKADGSGFYYPRFDEPKSGKELQEANYYQKLFFHKIGTPQSDDKLIYERKDQKELGFYPVVSDDGRYLIVVVEHGTSPKNGILLQDLADSSSKLAELFPPGIASYNAVGNDGGTFYFLSDENAPKGKLIAVQTKFSHDGVSGTKSDLIKSNDDTLEQVTYINSKFICKYMRKACSAVQIYDKNGSQQQQIELPGLGTAEGFSGRQTDNETYFSYSSFATPSTVYRLNLTDNSQSVFFKPHCKFNPDNYTTEQITCRSKDGTEVPMFISYKKGIELNGSNPTYLYGYGGFKISIMPTFSSSNLLWMERGGIYAVATLRGGGEFGESWHEAGMKLSKQKVFDDFIAAAETLIAKRYTRTDKLSIGGGSNGGLLVGACITQRPELYGAAVPAVGVMDMLRFNKFTVGWEWQQEYGSPQNAEEFKALYAYSPLHNIKKGTCYPATLITTADHDDRVVPGHSFKFAAAIQAAQGCDKPTLIRIDAKAGHGHGKSTKKLIDEATDKWTFLTKTLSVGDRQAERN